jgi:hypothetical protein
MKYDYKIIYDINRDMWNWRGGIDSSFFGKSNINNIKNDQDRIIANKIVGLKKADAETVLRPYLLAENTDPKSRLNQFIKLAQQDLKNKYSQACEALARITGRPMVPGKFTFFVTTFPRMVYFYEERYIFMYDSIEGVWGMPIDGFLHEGLHFQFTHYWREDKTSPVHDLSQVDFDYLKEALTVVLDEELKPIITVPDKSYPDLAPLREPLHAYWKKHHNFDKLVDYGVSLLGKFAR